MPTTHSRFHQLPRTLFREMASFRELESRIAQLDEELSRGDALEVFAEAYLRTSPLWQVDDLCLVGQVPLDWLQHLNLSANATGIDGVFRTRDGVLVPYQVKFRIGRPQVGVTAVATFLGLTERGPNRLLISNADRYADDVERRDRLRIVRGVNFDDLTADDLRAIEHWIYGEPVTRARAEPRPHQARALADIQTALVDHDRATVVMACGTGKTLVALWATEAQRPKTVLVLLPSLALLSQTLNEWAKHTCWGNQFEYLCVCSDVTVAGQDVWQLRSTEVPFPITTDASHVRAFLAAPARGHVRVVFSTYHSSPVVAAGMPDTLAFDVGIFDEAHKTTGAADSHFAFALQDARLRIKKRVFLTATPRHIDIRHRDREGEFKVISMDDPAVYGPRAHTLAFADAVAQDLICDYRVVVSVVDPDELDAFALQHGITLVQGDENATRWVATQVAVQRAIGDTGVSKVITFHGRVSHAQEFASDTSRGIGQFLDGFQVGHVNGEQSVSIRKQVLEGFASATQRLVTNARCLTEGVDLPAVDMVVFSSPRRSKVDIIQAVGRAMRKSIDGQKTIGYVVVPVLLPRHDADDLEAAVSETDWEDLIEVLAALKEHDVRLDATLAAIQTERGEGRAFDPRDLRDHIDVVGPQVSLEVLKRGIASAIIDRLGESWDLRYGELVAFKTREGHCNVPAMYPENRALGQWVYPQRFKKQRGTLSADRTARLEAIGFVWDPRTAAWEEMYAALAAYKAKHGNCTVPQGYPRNPALAHWVQVQRTAKKSGRLSVERQARLEALGFLWVPHDAAWEEMYAALAAYKVKHGSCNVPRGPAALSALAHWVQVQRTNKKRGRLTSARVARLDALGFVWALTPTWEEMLVALSAFKEQNGHCDVPLRSHGRLGLWCHNQRTYKKTGRLSSRQLEQLDALGFSWDPTNAAWEARFAELVAYKAREGHCNVPATYPTNPELGRWVGMQRRLRKRLATSRSTVPQQWIDRWQRLQTLGVVWDPKDIAWEQRFNELVAFQATSGHCAVPPGSGLYTWTANQRQLNRKGLLSSERCERMDALGFSWDPTNAAWEARFAELVAYKAREGHCNVPATYPTNPELGRWVGMQRRLRKGFSVKKSTVVLSPERVRRLDELGFVWAIDDAVWVKRIAELRAFKDKEGHCNVGDARNMSRSHKALSVWVQSLRQRRKRGSLNQQQIHELTKLGFQFEPKSTLWETRFAELERFKALEGHCRVPAAYEPNPALGHWVAMQRRRRFKKKTLSRQQIRRLTDLGFVWDLDIYEWESKLRALLAFKAVHGHCNVPARYSGDTALGTWVSEVRGRAKRRLSKTQIAQLNKLGFQWRLRYR